MEPKGDESATSNGIQSRRSLNSDGGNSDEVHSVDQQFNNDLQGVYDRNNEGGFEDVSRGEDFVAELNWEARGKRSESYGSADLDPQVESIFTLQSAQEALEKELLNFREIGRIDDSVDDLVEGLPSDLTSVNEASSSNRIQSGRNVHISYVALQSELKEVANREDMEAEVEDLFRQKIENEVEYMVMSRTVQKLRVAVVDQITLLEDQTILASEQAQMLNTLGNTEHKAAVLKEEAEKLLNSCADIESADETLKVQTRICKYTSYFLIQLALLVIILGSFILDTSPNDARVVPT